MRHLLLVGIVVLVATMPTAASAVVPLGPNDNAATTSTPTFTWQLEPGEEVFSLELSPNPAPGEAGALTDDTRKRSVVLANAQTSYAVGDRDPLAPGTWFWHVSSITRRFEFLWSPLRRIIIPDEPIRLHSFRLTYFQCIRQLSVDFAYSDNSTGQPAGYRLEFRRSRRGRLVASIRARATNGQEFRTFRKPRRLRSGRYYVRLRVRDAGGHVARSRFRRLRVDGC